MGAKEYSLESFIVVLRNINTYYVFIKLRTPIDENILFIIKHFLL